MRLRGCARRSLLFGGVTAGVAASLAFGCGTAPDAVRGGDARFDAARPVSEPTATTDAATDAPGGDAAVDAPPVDAAPDRAD